AFTPLGDGGAVEFGRVRLTALETPGHTAESISIIVYDLDRSASCPHPGPTPESISILVYDLARSASEPHAVLTGDTLFVGDVGRPDLRAALGWSADELGGKLYDSLWTKVRGGGG